MRRLVGLLGEVRGNRTLLFVNGGKIRKTMKQIKIGTATLIHGDCEEFMKDLPDKCFSLACIDPPYGIDAANMQMGKGKNKRWLKGKSWDKKSPDKNFFDKLMYVSVRQIIWGGNYFSLPITGGWIFWDKERGKDVSFADGELAWTSFMSVIKKAPIRYDGFIGADSIRIHPTQKPVKLYEWILKNYAKPGQTILDTHGGSMSSVIASLNMGFEITCIEKDEDYFNAAVERVIKSQQQQKLF